MVNQKKKVCETKDPTNLKKNNSHEGQYHQMLGVIL